MSTSYEALKLVDVPFIHEVYEKMFLPIVEFISDTMACIIKGVILGNTSSCWNWKVDRTLDIQVVKYAFIVFRCSVLDVTML